MHAASGWYADPALPGIERYWDGSTWTDERPVPGADHEAVAAAPLWSTVGFELPSYETLARMGADVVAGEETQKPKSARGRRGALKAVSVVVGAVAVATGSFAMVDRHSDANAAVVAAVNSALAGRSADISLSGSGSAAGSSFSITGTGAIDFTEGAMRLSVDVAHGSQQVSAQVIYENKVAYVNLGSALGQIVPGKSWVSLNVSQLSSTSGVSSFGSASMVDRDPATALQALRQEGNVATDLGSSTVDGVGVEGYSVDLTNPDLDYKVYVDRAGELVRLTSDVDETLAGQSVRESDTLDFSNYGSPVSVAPPPPGAVAPFQSFLKAEASLATHSNWID